MSEPTPDILSRLSACAALLLAARVKLEEATDSTTRAQASVDDLERRVIPELMGEAKMQEFTTLEGLHLALDEDVRGNTKSADLHEWLRACGNGGLIKTAVVVPFSKGGDEDANKLVAELAARELKAVAASDVAWNSLQTLVKDMRKRGEEVPLERLKLHLIPKVRVTMPRRRGPGATNNDEG